MRVAHALGKFEEEILGLSVDELARWIAYLDKYDQPKGAPGR